MTDLTVDLARELRLAHPVTVASGGAGYGVEILDAVQGRLPSAISTRGVTMSARSGARGRRMAPLRDGLLHAVGRPNAGVARVLERFSNRWAEADPLFILNIGADTPEGYGDAARAADLGAGVAAIEIDLSFSDRAHGSRPFGITPGPAEAATVAARAATDLPLIAKLTPEAVDIREVARAVVAAGADVISAVGGQPGLTIDPARRSATLGSGYGWVSGPALKPVGVRAVYEIAQVTRVPIIGIGGIATLDDVLDYLAAGASAVGLATAALADPGLPGRLASELGDRLERAGVQTVTEFVGRALPSKRDRGSLRTGPNRI